MESIPSLPTLGIDPLIAESKRRARRRRVWLFAAVVAGAAVAATLSSTLRPSGSVSAPARPGWLRDATARGTLVSLNRRTAVAEFRVSCGWHTARDRATTKLRPGLYSVPLRGATFNVESGVDPKIPGSGVANEMSLSKWESYGGRSGWKGWLAVYKTPYFSDGPSHLAEICHGVFWSG